MLRLLAVICLHLLVLGAGSRDVFAQTAVGQAESASTVDRKTLRANLEASRAEIEHAEAALRRPDLSADDLQGLRTAVDPVSERLRTQVADLDPRIDAAKARLEQLGPKPKEGAPAEGPEVAKDRQDREASLSDLDEISRLSKAQLVQAEQITQQISDRRRSAFTSALFQRSYSVISPQLWLGTATAFPRDLRALRLLASDAIGRAQDRATLPILTVLGLSIGVGAALYLARNRIAPRLVHRDPAATAVTPVRKVASAFGVLLTETVPAAIGCLLIYQAVQLTDVTPSRLVSVVGALMAGFTFVAFVQGLIDAIFAPDRPAWRLVELPEEHATALMRFGTSFAILVLVGRVLDALNQAIAAALPLSVACKAVVATLAALALAELLRRLAKDPLGDGNPEDSCLGPYVSTQSRVGGPIKFVGWAMAGAVIVAAVAGYIAFASFAVDQIVWIGSIAGVLYLLWMALDRFVGDAMVEDGRVSTVLQTNLGLRRASLRQVAVLGSGVGRVVLVVIAGLLVLAPWGIESGDYAGSLQAAFFGFKVGDVTVSLSGTITAIAFFVAVIAVTRVVQRWLDRTFLPTTQIDAGLRNSITTAAGYVGFFVAAAIAVTYLGLSLEKMAIVAGALSVGIGFGLQSIVNNFVSGLILLWERPIRVGDLIVVSDGEGYVRRISVRATEIQLLDRSTVIVPNSNLISGTVKNRVRGDLTGRVLLSINVLRNQDPARAAELLIEQASAHPDVLRDPPPRVFFKKIGDTMLEFDLICIVQDVTRQARVQSDLNFAVFKTLVDDGVIPPLGPGAMTIGGLEPVQSALQAIAASIDHEAAKRRAADVDADRKLEEAAAAESAVAGETDQPPGPRRVAALR